MSKERTIIHHCEHCNKEFEATIFDSINIDVDPELREKVLNGDIFVYECPHCKQRNIIQYRCLYHDMKNKFMVQLGAKPTIYDFKRFFEEGMNNSMENIGLKINAFDEYQICGVTAWGDMVTAIIALENGLDRRLVVMQQAIVVHQYIDYAKENNKPGYLDSSLRYDNDGKLVYAIETGNDGNYEGTICKFFDQDLHEELSEDTKYQYANSFYFDLESAIKFLNYEEEELSKAINTVKTYAFVEVRNGGDDVVYIPKFNEKKYNIGDYVIIEDKSGWTYEARIYHIEELSEAEVFRSPEKMRKVLWTIKPVELTTTGDSHDELDNEELADKLIKWEETRKNFPNSEVFEADIIVGLVTTLSDEFLDSLDNVEDLKKDMEISPEHIVADLATIEKDNNCYMKVYLDQSDIKKVESENPMIYSFNDIIEYVIRCSSKYEGIAVYTGDKEIILRTPYLLNVYIPDKTLTNPKKVISVLEKLTAEEKEYVSELSYKIICMVYFDGKNPTQIANELHIEKEKVGNALSKGYANLQEVIKHNYQ